MLWQVWLAIQNQISIFHRIVKTLVKTSLPKTKPIIAFIVSHLTNLINWTKNNKHLSTLEADKTRNTTRCNNHDDLIHLSFVVKISLFWEVFFRNRLEYLWWSFFGDNNTSLTIFTKNFIIDACSGSKYASSFTLRLFKPFISFKYFTSANSSNMLLNSYSLNHLIC